MATDARLNRFKQTENLSLLILCLGAGLGLLADRLFGATGPTGVGFFLWTVLFASTLGWLISHLTCLEFRQVLCWLLTAIAAAGMILFRTVPILIFALLLVMLVAMAMIVLQLGNKSLLESAILEHLRAALIVPLQALTGALPVVSNVDLSAGFQSPRGWSILRGILLTLPILLIFGGLFSSADAGFSRLASGLFDIFSPQTLQHLALTLVFAWLSTGLLASSLGNRFFEERSQVRMLKLGTEDTAVLLGSLAALFLVFVFMQLGYLFGGRETIEATSGLTLAQYARRGFFELLIVAGLTLALLVLVAGSGCNQRVFRPFASVLLGCVLIIQASAVQRLLLYILAFGLSIDRLIALSVLIWLATGLFLFAGTLLRGQTNLFAAGMTVSGVVVVFLLALTNPVAIVARTNIGNAGTHYNALDTGYLLDLGADAVPALIDAPGIMTIPSHQCAVIIHLFARWYDAPHAGWLRNRDWRDWNYSQRRAANLIENYQVRLKVLAADCVVDSRLMGARGSLTGELVIDGRPVTAESLISWINAEP